VEIVLVGAPGSGGRVVGQLLAERHGGQFVDLSGTPDRSADRLSGLRRAGEPDTGPALRRIIAADRVLADPGVRARLYRSRRVIWLDVPVDRLLERLRAASPRSREIDGGVDLRLADHLADFTPYYFAGSRVDATGSIAETIATIESLMAKPAESGTLILRADIHGGLLELGEGILARSLDHVVGRLSARRCVVVTTARHRVRADGVASEVRDRSGLPVDVLELPEGEPAKRLVEQERLLQSLARLRLERGDPLIAVGDDVLLEAVTFAAAVYLRGVPFVTVPVTTLGLIDTSIGGKGGVDLPGVGRNLLGAIHQPVASILDIDMARDEPVEERHAALAEAIKYGLIGDDALLALLETSPPGDGQGPWPGPSELLEIVERCALAKRRLVLADERDTTGVRMALNLGHTLSHALEAATGYRLRHGEAVAYGLRAALWIGHAIGVTPAPIENRAERLLRRLELATAPLDVSVDDVLTYVDLDKKRLGGRLRWVLVGIEGVTVRDDVPETTVRAAVARALAGTAT